MDNLKTLMKERDGIDAELAEQREILKQNNATMDSSLVDAEGFPIASIDVYSVRHARVAIIRLMNDRKELEEKLKTALEEAHQEARLEKEKNGDSMDTDTQKVEAESSAPVHRTSNKPFVKVKAIKEGGPAKQDGLQESDMIIQWGSIHHGTYSDVKQLSLVAQHSEDKVLRVTVLRDDRPVRLEIRPRKWAGIGLLGCALENHVGV